MKNRKLIALIITVVIMIVLLSGLGYLMAPAYTTFEWSSINPLTPFASIVFSLSWLGTPLPLAVLIMLLLTLFIGWLIYRAVIARMKKGEKE